MLLNLLKPPLNGCWCPTGWKLLLHVTATEAVHELPVFPDAATEAANTCSVTAMEAVHACWVMALVAVHTCLVMPVLSRPLRLSLLAQVIYACSVMATEAVHTFSVMATQVVNTCLVMATETTQACSEMPRKVVHVSALPWWSINLVLWSSVAPWCPVP